MTKSTLHQSDDSAVAPITGILFQFEKALVALASLENPTDYLTIEEVDDVATHSDDGCVLATFQAKHSMCCSGTTFPDTSKSLWRTLQIWITKINSGLLNSNTVFICSTNREVPEDSLIRFIQENPIKEVLNKIKDLLLKQELKLKEKKKSDPAAGTSIAAVIKLIKFVIKDQKAFEIIKNTLTIHHNEQARQNFMNRLHVQSSDVSDLQRTRFYEEFYGWIVHNSKARWMNGKEAKFIKKDFDARWFQIRSNPSIVNAIFRTKEFLGDLLGAGTDEEVNKKKSELFVKQIEDIDRRKEAKERILKNAILDFIYAEIEIKHIVEKGDYTQIDFEGFLDDCTQNWQALFDSKVVRELDEYSDAEKNILAIDIFDHVMNVIKIEFKEGFCFTTSNEYLKKGCFLKLSNVPKIGWHPEWKTRYTE